MSMKMAKVRSSTLQETNSSCHAFSSLFTAASAGFSAFTSTYPSLQLFGDAILCPLVASPLVAQWAPTLQKRSPVGNQAFNRGKEKLSQSRPWDYKNPENGKTTVISIPPKVDKIAVGEGEYHGDDSHIHKERMKDRVRRLETHTSEGKVVKENYVHYPKEAERFRKTADDHAIKWVDIANGKTQATEQERSDHYYGFVEAERSLKALQDPKPGPAKSLMIGYQYRHKTYSKDKERTNSLIQFWGRIVEEKAAASSPSSVNDGRQHQGN